MGSLRKRKSSLDKRLKRIDKELKSVRRHVGALSKSVDEGSLPRGAFRDSGRAATGRDSIGGSRETQAQPEVQPGEAHAARRDGSRDERFTDYLASSFRSVTPLRHERRIQRNRAIFMIVFAALLLFLIIWKLFI